MKTCTYCAGRGSIEKSRLIGAGSWARWVTVPEACPACSGSEQIPESRGPRVEAAMRPDPVGTITDFLNDTSITKIPGGAR